MGHKANLLTQITNAYQKMLAIGQSKHIAKKNGTADTKIFSWETYHSYKKHAVYFADWCKEHFGCTTIEECRRYAPDWLQSRIDEGLSPYTVKLEASALAKLFRCKAEDFGVQMPTCHRADIKRSRGVAVRDRNFSVKNNADLIGFLRATGLRRSEATNLRGTALVQDETGCYIKVIGKGGKSRLAKVIGDVELVKRMCSSAGEGKVFPNGINTNCDVHGYRAEYATAFYKALRRDFDTCKADKSLYWCRRDLKGSWFDKKAMLTVSRSLGHNRISVIASHYLREQKADPEEVLGRP